MSVLSELLPGVRGRRMVAVTGSAIAVPVLAAACLTGCGDPPIASYRVPRETAPAAAADAGGAEAEATATARWKVPGGWKPVAAGQMQMARFAVPNRGDARAEVSVSVFATDTGGALGNVNRWRGQIGLPPVSETELSRQVTPLDAAEPGAILVNLGNGGRQLVAAIVPRGGQWYFYKLLGDAAAVAPEIEAFTAFVKSEP